MKKVISISAILIYLVYTTEIRQLLKLPILIEHFHEHRLIDPCISFFNFLEMHYSENETQNPDYQRDMQLPFKSIEFSSTVYFVILPQSNLELDYFLNEFYNYKIKVEDISQKSNLLAEGIWQPPKYWA